MQPLKTVILALAMVLAPGAMAQTTAPAEAPTSATSQGKVGRGDPAIAAELPAVSKSSQQTPDTTIGQPIPNGYELQPQVTPVGRQARWMHDWILMPTIVGISILVLMLLLYASWRYRAKANPVPSKVSHNTTIEVIWTLAPVAILLVIALFSFDLLHAQQKPPGKNAITIKAIGNQWYWSYEYPDNGGIEITANMLPEAEAKRRGEPRLLATDNRLVLPVGVPIRLQTTSNDVIHAFAVPAFWAQMDAVPGRINETSFTVERPGVYYGQCNNICGARHAFMPIAIEAVSLAEFNRWVVAKGGNPKGMAPRAVDTVPGSAPVPALANPGAAATVPPAPKS